MPTPKKLNGLPALLIVKTDVMMITIAIVMVMTVVMTMIAVTMTATRGVMIVQIATPSTPVSSAPTTWILASYWTTHALSTRMPSTPYGSAGA